MDYKRLQLVRMRYTRLQGVTSGYTRLKGLQEITESYKA